MIKRAKVNKVTEKVKAAKVVKPAKVSKKKVSSKQQGNLLKATKFNLKQLVNYREFIRHLMSDEVDCELTD